MKCPLCETDGLGEKTPRCPNCGTRLTAGGGAAAPQAASAAAPGADRDPVIVVQTWFHSLPDNLRHDVRWGRQYKIFSRERELAKLTDALSKYQKVLLYGERGVGKSTLAAEAVEGLLGRPSFMAGCLWVSSIRNAPVAAMCDAVAAHLNEPSLLELKPKAKPEALRKLLAERHFLVLLEDLEWAESAELFFRNCVPRGVAMLAVGEQPFADVDTAVLLDRPGSEAATALFRSRAEIDGADDLVAEVCARLGNNPLALVFAAAWVRGKPERLARLPELLKRPADVPPQPGADHAAGSATQTLLRHLCADLDPQTRRVLEYAAAAFGHSIGIELLAAACERTPAACEQDVGQLTERMLAESSGGRVSVHTLVRAFVREALGDGLKSAQEQLLRAACAYAVRHAEQYPRLEEEAINLIGAAEVAARQEHWRSAVQLANVLQPMLDERGHWTKAVEVGGHAIKAAERLGDDEALLSALQATGTVHRKLGNYASASRLLEQELSIYTRLERPDGVAAALHALGLVSQGARNLKAANDYFRRSCDLYSQLGDKAGEADNHHQLGIVAQREGDATQAAKHYKQALRIRARLSPDSPEVAQILNNMALLHEWMGGEENYFEARRLYEQAIDIYRKEPQTDWAEYANSLNNFAKLHFTMGDYSLSREYYERALEIRTAEFGPNHPDVAQVCNNLAGVYYAQADYAEAMKCLERALNVYHVSVGDSHPGYATTLGNLAGIYHAIGNYAEAAVLYTRAIELYRARLGRKHLELAQLLNNFALLHQAQGDYAKAMELMKQAMSIRRTKLGTSHPAYAQLLHNLASLYQSQGEYAKAKAHMLEALETRRKSLGASHPDLAQSLGDLADLCQAQGEYTEAARLLGEAVNIYRQTLGDKHITVAHRLYDLALLHQVSDRAEEAEALYRQALDIYRRTAGGENYIACLNNLADLCRVKGLHRDAATLYQEQLDVCRRTRGENNPYVLQSLLNLGQVSKELRDDEGSLNFFLEGQAVAKASHDHTGLANVLYNLGVIRAERREYELARDDHSRSLEIYKALGDKMGMARNMHRLGLITSATHKFEEARGFFHDSLEINKEVGTWEGRSTNLKELGRLSLWGGSEEESRQYERTSRQLAGNIDSLVRLRDLLADGMEEDELRALLSKLGVEEKSLPGKGLRARATELTAWAYHHGKVNELKEAVRSLRPGTRV